MRGHDILQKLFGLCGYDLIAKRKNGWRLENLLTQVLKTYDINLVLDVGANVGQYGRLLRRAGYKGRIVSFEPVRKSFEALKIASAGDPLWSVHHCALGDKEERLKINVFQNSDLSSFCSSSRKMGTLFAKGGNTSVNVEEVQVRTVDAVFNDISDGVSDLRIMLKMDTQGYDLNIFKGATKTVSQIPVIQSELSCVPLYDGMPDIVEALRIYRDAGYHIAGMIPVAHEEGSLRVIEFDCVLVKQK